APMSGRRLRARPPGLSRAGHPPNPRGGALAYPWEVDERRSAGDTSPEVTASRAFSAPGGARGAAILIGAACVVMASAGTARSAPPVFAPALSFPAGDGPRGIALGDVNRDGHLDVVVADYGPDMDPGRSVALLLGNGDGTLQPPVMLPVDQGPFAVALGDF